MAGGDLKMVPAPESQPAPIRVLVVEDEVLIRILVADELREVGFSVIEAANADEALSYLKAGGDVDLVFSDIRMPGSLDGLELARQLRGRYPSLPIILTSGNFFGTYGPHGANLFIAKPYKVERVIAIISTILMQRSDGTP
jgi:CheY-like chemotaxis protein